MLFSSGPNKTQFLHLFYRSSLTLTHLVQLLVQKTVSLNHLHLSNCNSPILGLIIPLATLLEQVHLQVGWSQELLWFHTLETRCVHHLGCHNRTLQTGWLKPENLFPRIVESRSPRSKCWGLVSSVSSLPGLLMAVFMPCHHGFLLVLELSQCLSSSNEDTSHTGAESHPHDLI